MLFSYRVLKDFYQFRGWFLKNDLKIFNNKICQKPHLVFINKYRLNFFFHFLTIFSNLINELDKAGLHGPARSVQLIKQVLHVRGPISFKLDSNQLYSPVSLTTVSQTVRYFPGKKFSVHANLAMPTSILDSTFVLDGYLGRWGRLSRTGLALTQVLLQTMGGKKSCVRLPFIRSGCSW
jgi:hypothetical protein